MGPGHIAQGWHSGATLGVFSAAAGVARALDLDVEKTVHALGIAGTQATGLMAAQSGAMVKRMHAGRASQSGLYGALFAEGGFTGMVNVLESECGGFCATFSRSTDRFDLKELTAGFGEVWLTMGDKKVASETYIVEKFGKLAGKALPKTQVEDLRDAMLSLDKLPDATKIARLLAII
jgi:2-methylcitrate dehydratase PrpD